VVVSIGDGGTGGSGATIFSVDGSVIYVIQYKVVYISHIQQHFYFNVFTAQ